MEIQTIKGLIVDKGFIISDIIDKMKMTRSTFYTKLEEPEEFSIAEIKELAEIINCNAMEIADIITQYKKSKNGN